MLNLVKHRDIKMLDWSIVSMTTTEFFDQVHLEYGGPADAEYDCGVFAGPVGGGIEPSG